MDNDGYIDVSTHAQLNAIRYDLDGNGDPTSGGATAYNAAFPNRVTTSSGRMGCPSGTCTGYELTANIDLDTDGDGRADSDDTYWHSGAGWQPIGADTTGNRYSGGFKGNGYVINKLFINRTTTSYQALFGSTSSASRIEALGITNASVRGDDFTGILVAANHGNIIACYTAGSVTGDNRVGGLAAWSSGSISTSYSHANVTGTQRVGGLLGLKANTGSITNSYSIGAVSRSSGSATSIGGLLGESNTGTGTVTASYWDINFGQTTSAGGSGAVGKTSTELRLPAGYTGIYSAWNINLDSVSGVDYPWYFGARWAYPTLIYGTTVDYDPDNDGYIDVENHAQLNAIRHDLDGNGDATHNDYINAFPRRDTNTATRMGCPSGTCVGYELTSDIQFDENVDGQITQMGDPTYWNGGAGWDPIGTDVSATTRYSGDFKGNGNPILGLFINRPATNAVGLFGAIHTTSRIDTMAVTNANVTAQNYVGILVGVIRGDVVASYTGGDVSGDDHLGGLAGAIIGASASVHSSYSGAQVSGTNNLGGLIGTLTDGAITNSFTHGWINTSGSGANIGGLIGQTTGGSVTASYWDTFSAESSGVAGQTTSALQNPTGYTGIYSTWNANIDGVSGNDDPWSFGTAREYPLLKYGGHDLLFQSNNYDQDLDGYIDIFTLAQLNAVRYDLDGDGHPTSGGAATYNAAFPNRLVSVSNRNMGCPSTCIGYELVADLDFDENGDGDITQTGDPTYWNSGAGWNPIGSSSAQYSGDFKGDGHTINNLFINANTTGYRALFGSIAFNSRIETLGVTNANITGQNYVGILSGSNQGTIIACYTTGKAQGGNRVGGLVAYNVLGNISSSYSTAYVSGTANVGGLVGWQLAGSSSVTNSYSTGRVSRSSGSATTVGGLIGQVSAGSVTASYWDTSTSGQTTSAGGSGVTGKTTRQLQTPTGYTGIYANWNANLDGVTGNDDPWTFGNKMQYPMLDYKMMSTNPQGGQAMGIPDNWNAPIVGERVGVCLNAATRPNRSGKWIWERSDNGDTWEVISGITAPTYEYAPTTADVDHFLRAKVALSGGGFAYTRALGGRVKNASAATAGSAITFYNSGNVSPRVGELIIANDPRPTGAVDARFAWQRCDNADTTYTDCEYIFGVWWTNYTPVAADMNHYLRMYVYYETSAGVWTRHASAFTGQVAAASQ